MSFEKLAELYQESQGRPSVEPISWLIYGDYGTGKTHSLSTLPMPGLIYSFDPGGHQLSVLRPFMESGKILVRSYKETSAGEAYMTWKRDFEMDRRSKIFDHLNFVALDSMSTWCSSMLEGIAANPIVGGTRPGGLPALPDYGYQQKLVYDHLKHGLLTLPCHQVVIAHIERTENHLTGGWSTSLNLPGRLGQKPFILFGEVYVAMVTGTSKGPEHSFLTKNDGVYQARTRLGGPDLFDVREKPDFKHLLRKAKIPCDDKPTPWVKEDKHD